METFQAVLTAIVALLGVILAWIQARTRGELTHNTTVTEQVHSLVNSQKDALEAKIAELQAEIFALKNAVTGEGKGPTIG